MASMAGPMKSKARLGWAPGNRGWAQVIRNTMSGRPENRTSGPEINGWAQIKSMAMAHDWETITMNLRRLGQ